MKVFVAGATGVLGRVLVPQLVARGHEVVGMTRSASKQDLVRSLGARPVGPMRSIPTRWPGRWHPPSPR
jgi:nucleoside-diphosphate-sugar epimerase